MAGSKQFRELKALVDHLTRPLQDAADALTELSESVTLWVELEKKRFEKDFPHIEVKPAFVGRAKYANPEKDKPEEEGDIFPGEKVDRFLGIGPRERKRIEAEKRAQRRLAKQTNGSTSPARVKVRPARGRP